jgi:hypothetical protein
MADIASRPSKKMSLRALLSGAVSLLQADRFGKKRLAMTLSGKRFDLLRNRHCERFSAKQSLAYKRRSLRQKAPRDDVNSQAA